MAGKNKAIFLDRDGVITVDVGYTHKLEDFALEEGVIEGLKKLQDENYLLIITTGQSGIARGKYKVEDYERFQNHLVRELENQGIHISQSYFCPHLPEEWLDKAIEEYKIVCNCRKPKTGMIEQAQQEYDIDLEKSVVLGDKTDDMKMANNAGCSAILVMTKSGKKGQDGQFPDAWWDHKTKNLNEAADWIIKYIGK